MSCLYQKGDLMKFDRRSFIASGAATVAAGCATSSAEPKKQTQSKNIEAEKSVRAADPLKGTQGVPLKVGEPCLQAASSTSMGISWAVSGLSKGVVEYADNPEFANSAIVKSGGYALVPIDTSALQVRLTALKPSTKYYYRTITTPFTDYSNIYNAKLGRPIVGKTYSFTTLGKDNRGKFAMISDTHAQWKSYELRAKHLKDNPPAVLVWNGDATNTTQSKATAVEIFLSPPIPSADFAAEIPVAFVAGNHDYRGSWISKINEVLLPRLPSERDGEFWDLKWNFAERVGDMAVIGVDTGEDKPDAHPKWFGLANFEPYRKAQAKWLEQAFSRPEIASAKYKVVFCHIPLYASPDHPDYAHDGVKIDPDDWAYWSRECYDLWNPIMEKAGVQLVVAGHKHRYRHDLPSPGRSWHQVVGGGHELGTLRGKPDAERFPTVIEGEVKEGKLVVTVHDVFGKCVADKFSIP
jgi:phosphodiesterase/alkaline phosphatase D-like protein